MTGQNFVLMAFFFSDGKRFKAEELDQEKIKALDDSTRQDILKILKTEPSYPAAVSKTLDISKQKTYYHFKKLEEADIIEEDRKKDVSGGVATFYKPRSEGFVLKTGSGTQGFVPKTERSVERFLKPLIDSGKLNGKVVVGSPDEHGPDQVRARDGHLSSEIGMKLGNYAEVDKLIVLDTEAVREDLFEKNLLVLGGVLTNTATKKLNDSFPASFEGKEFPYRKLVTPKATYTSEKVGVIAKAENPENPDASIFMIAGIRGEGTRAAVEAFKNLENIVEAYRDGEFYAVVKGLDMDGDGKIDSYEVIEK